MSSYSSQSIDSHLYHRYLKGESLSFDTQSVAASSVPSPIEPTEPPKSQACHWDLRETCKPLFPAFDYISHKLSLQGLSIHLIVSDQSPFVIPVWPLPHHSQITLCGIIRRTCKKFGLSPSWMTALASLRKEDLPQVFEAFKPDSYIIKRSMLQREIVYQSSGLTLLSIDHIFTLKQLLCTLSKKDWVSTARGSCLSSCVHLLHRIHSVYTGKPASAGYIARVYREIPFQDDALEEVVTEYNAKYCTASIYEVSFQPDFTSIYEDEVIDYTVPELPSTTYIPPTRSTSSSDDNPVSPLDVDVSMIQTWEAVPLGPNPDYDVSRPASVAYPSVRGLTASPPKIPPIPTVSTIFFPPPPSPPPSYPLPSLPPSNPSTSSLDDNTEEGCNYDRPPSPLKISKRSSDSRPANAFPSPPNHRASTFPLLAPSVFSDEIESAVDGEFSWELDVLESPRSYIESWSSGTEGALCQRCHEVVGAGMARRETI